VAQSQLPQKNVPMTAVGMLVFVSHLVLLAFFILSGNVLSFWGNRWVISLVFILVLLLVGLGLLYLAEMGARKTFYQVVFSTGVIYMAISALLYGSVIWLHFQNTDVNTTQGTGLFTLFLFFFSTGFASIRFSLLPRLLRSISYVYLAMFGIYLVSLAAKYLVFSSLLVHSTFFIELLLLAVAGGAFAYLFIEGTRHRR
jgi:hypothetical protein